VSRYFADVNGNGACDAPPTDHAWAAAVPAVTGDTALPVTHTTTFTTVTGDTTLSVTHTTVFTNVCASF
jgi:hypothetical protein